jgi:predicted HTH transcriptional regulator
MDKEDRIRACYQHCCLRHVTGEPMTNPSLRDRFKLNSNQSATVSRIIRDTIEKGLVKSSNPDSESRKYASYIPYWA